MDTANDSLLDDSYVEDNAIATPHSATSESVDVELEELRSVRRALSKMNQGLENVQHQLKYFNSNVGQTTQLLDTWVRILSQTSHNQSFLSNDAWQGGSNDTVRLTELVQRDFDRRQEEERKEREEAERREREAAEALVRERRRAEAIASQQQKPERPPVHAGLRPGYRGSSRPSSVGVGSGVGRGSRIVGGGRGRGSMRGVRGRALPPSVRSQIQPPK